LEKGDVTAHELSAQLTSLLVRIEGFEAAAAAAGSDLRGHLVECFAELIKHQSAALSRLGFIGIEQRLQGRRQRNQSKLLEELVDRLRYLMVERPSRDHGASLGEAQQVVFPLVVEPAVTITAHGMALWYGGAEVTIGDRVYQIHGNVLEEHFSPDRSVVRRQARGLQLVPTRAAHDGYVWLRQVEVHRGVPAARIALQALGRENDLLGRLKSVRGIPKVSRFVAGDRTATLVTGWPASRSTGGLCDTLDALLGRDGTPLDAWRVSRLCTGLAGLSVALARLHDQGVVHRYVTPAGIIMLDDGRLVLRDLGLATRDPEPGEGPADYQAPEQRPRSYRRPGPHTDVYQLAAVAYHLVTGCPPHAGIPLPVRAQARDVPERIGRALDAALAQAPTERPDIRSLGSTLRAARDELS
jgi:hypothetical protein